MTDFNKICYRAVIEFLTLENVPPQQIHNRMTVVYGECAPSYATVKRWQQSFVKEETALKMSPGWDVRLKLSVKMSPGRDVRLKLSVKMSPGRDVRLKLSVKKTVVLLKILYCKIVESMCN